LRKDDFIYVLQVEEVLDELIRVRIVNYNSNDTYQQYSWHAKDSDKFQRLGTYQNLTRVKWAELLEKNHEKQLRIQQQQ
jgi:hypothetical protein